MAAEAWCLAKGAALHLCVGTEGEVVWTEAADFQESQPDVEMVYPPSDSWVSEAEGKTNAPSEVLMGVVQRGTKKESLELEVSVEKVSKDRVIGWNCCSLVLGRRDDQLGVQKAKGNAPSGNWAAPSEETNRVAPSEETRGRYSEMASELEAEDRGEWTVGEGP